MENKEYLIQKTTLDGIANQSMTLVGKTGTVTTSEIISDLSGANEEVDAQSTLIDQLSEMLEGKAAGGEATPEINEVATIDFYNGLLDYMLISYISSGNKVCTRFINPNNSFTINTIKNSNIEILMDELGSSGGEPSDSWFDHGGGAECSGVIMEDKPVDITGLDRTLFYCTAIVNDSSGYIKFNY